MAKLNELNTKFLLAATLLVIIIMVQIYVEDKVDEVASDLSGKDPPESNARSYIKACGKSFCRGVFISVATAGSVPAALGTGLSFALMPPIFGI